MIKLQLAIDRITKRVKLHTLYRLVSGSPALNGVCDTLFVRLKLMPYHHIAYHCSEFSR